MKYGYARISADDQTMALQRALIKFGCKTILEDEGLSGAITKRAALLCCLLEARYTVPRR